MATTEDIKKWYKNLKRNLVIGFGGKCCICGYNNCQDAFDLHHLDPNLKSFSISSFKVKNKMKIYDEAKKCVLLCANCHREFHAGIIKIETPVMFDEALIPAKQYKSKICNCEVCGNISKNSRFCSPKCCGEFNRKSGLSNEKIVELRKTMSNVEIGKLYNVSEAAIRKRYKKLSSKNL